MDIYDLEVFLSVIQRGNFSKASEKLAITQPALSQRIKQLESELGYSLFLRRKGCQFIELTPQGEQFAHIAKDMLSMWVEAKKLRAVSGNQKYLRVSIIDSVLTCTIPSVIRLFVDTYPEVDITVSSYHSLESYEEIEKNNLDIAIVGKLSRARGSIVYPIYSDPWVFVCGRGENYPDIVHPTDLDSSKQLLLCSKEVDDWEEYWFAGSGKKTFLNKITHYNEHIFSNGSWAVLPQSIARFLESNAHGQIYKLADGPAPRIIYMVHSNKADVDAVKWFKQCVYKSLLDVQGISLMFDPGKRS